jgi:hypothetical protein
MTSTYNGPTRHEILLQVMKYNKYHHTADHIVVSNANQDSDLTPMRQMVEDEKNASDSAKQLKESLKELQDLRRIQLKHGPLSSRSDWANVRAAGRKLVKAAETWIAKHDIKTAVAQAEGKYTIRPDFSKAVMKPVPPPLPIKEVKTNKLQRPMSPQPVPHFPNIDESLSKKVTRSILPVPPKLSPKNQRIQRSWCIPAIPPYKPKPRPSSPKQKANKPVVPVKSQEKRPQSAEEKERQRRFIIEQKEIEAHLQAKKLHSEVRKYGPGPLGE